MAVRGLLCPQKSRLSLDVQDRLDHVGLVLVDKARTFLLQRVHLRRALLYQLQILSRCDDARLNNSLVVYCVPQFLCVRIGVDLTTLPQINFHISRANIGRRSLRGELVVQKLNRRL